MLLAFLIALLGFYVLSEIWNRRRRSHMTQAQKEAEIAEAEKSTDWWDIQP
jgi:hypothetical protein